MEGKEPSAKFLVSVVYVSILLDNVLLTAIVPVIPLHLNEMMASSAQDIVASSIQTPPIADLTIRENIASFNQSAKPLIAGRLTLHRVPLKVLKSKQDEEMRVMTRLKNIRKEDSNAGADQTANSFPSSVAVDLAKTLGQHLGGGRTGFHRHFTSPARNNANNLEPIEGLNQERANEKIGFLLSSKALVQLVANPLVGWWANRVGYALPLLVGSSYLLVSSLVFSFGRTYVMLFFARSLQGIASACITVAGMGLVAERYEGDEQLRSKILGHIMGAVALGVLIGYPMGSILNTVISQSAPFLVLSGCMLLNTAVQFASFRPSVKAKELLHGEPNSSSSNALIRDKFVLITIGAISCSTTAMAVLEPCLPLWLKQTVPDVKDWQLGLIFIPDSLGYLVGTNFLGVMAFKVGRWRAAALAMFTTGCSALLIPLATKPWHLALPHFFLGLGIGAVDAALMPLLAYLVDTRHQGATYGTVYALAQFSVSFAYFSGPFVGGEIAESVGFSWLMRIVGLVNVLYSPLCCLLRYHDATIPLLQAAGFHGDDERKGFWKDLVKLPHTTVSYKTMASESTSDLALSEEPTGSSSSVSTPSVHSAVPAIAKRGCNSSEIRHTTSSAVRQHVSCEACKFSPDYLKQMDH